MNPVYKQTRFLTSVYDPRRLPLDEGAEVAFAGRSNAGKSSALNTLCQQRGLAQISKAPGRTRTINFFAIDADRRLVDLPGYGYARAPAAMRRHWRTLVEHYLDRRQSLRGLIWVMDIRHPFGEHDRQLLAWYAPRALPLHVLLTKADKLSRGAASSTVQKARNLLGSQGIAADVQTFSALRREGVEGAHRMLDTWLDL